MFAPKKCRDCEIVLNSENWIKYNSCVRVRCRKCDNKYYKEYYRKKAIEKKKGQWF